MEPEGSVSCSQEPRYCDCTILWWWWEVCWNAEHISVS